jgi:hypothetical protein
MAKRQNVSEQIEAINLLKLEMKARELLPQTAYDYLLKVINVLAAPAAFTVATSPSGCARP